MYHDEFVIRTVGEIEEEVLRPINSEVAEDPGDRLTYHDGIIALWRWLSGETEINPLEAASR